MAAAVSELVEWRSMGLSLLAFPRNHFCASGADVFLQHGADAEASTVQDPDHRAGWIRRGAGSNWTSAVLDAGSRARDRHFLVCGESCRVHVPLYLVSWHVPALSF